MDQLHGFWQQGFEAMFKNGVGLAAADFHQGHGAIESLR
jgi:hypothetical protein